MPDARGVATDAEQSARDEWLAAGRSQAKQLRDSANRLLGLFDDIEFRDVTPSALYGPWGDASEAATSLIDCWTGPDYGPTEKEIRDAAGDARRERELDK
jgi:hypothetical protein